MTVLTNAEGTIMVFCTDDAEGTIAVACADDA